MNYKQEIVKELAESLHNLGFRVYLSYNREYGFFTDDTGARVVSFQTDLGRIMFSGNYQASREGR